MSHNQPEQPDMPEPPDMPYASDSSDIADQSRHEQMGIPDQSRHEQSGPEQPRYPQQQPTQYVQQPMIGYANPAPAPPGAQFPPMPEKWQPPPSPGGKIWLGILLGAGVPILGFLLARVADGVGLYDLSLALVALPFWLVLILAIVLTIIRSQRRTGIGMWIGLAALPIIGFGVCVVMIFGVGNSF